MSKKANKIIKEYAWKGVEAAFSCDTSIDEDLVIKLTDGHREMHGKSKCKEFLVFDSPGAAQKAFPACKVSNAFFGNMDADWLIPAKYARDVLGRDDLSKIQYLIELVNHVGWFWMSKEKTIVTRRPESIHWRLDSKGARVVHSVDGPAIKYKDGWGLFVIDGELVGVNHL